MFESKWDCDLDSATSDCVPNYIISRLDNQTDSISSGFNFRTAFYEDDCKRRTLKKLHGIRIIFFTSGTGGQFDLASLTITLGAGLFWIGVASVLTDIVLENFLPESVVYDKAKTALLKAEIVQTTLETAKSQDAPTHNQSIDIRKAVSGDEVAHDVFSKTQDSYEE